MICLKFDLSYLFYEDRAHIKHYMRVPLLKTSLSLYCAIVRNIVASSTVLNPLNPWTCSEQLCRFVGMLLVKMNAYKILTTYCFLVDDVATQETRHLKQRHETSQAKCLRRSQMPLHYGKNVFNNDELFGKYWIILAQARLNILQFVLNKNIFRFTSLWVSSGVLPRTTDNASKW